MGEWNHSLFILGTVISRNVADQKVIVDAGLKSLSFDSGPPRLWPFSKFEGVTFSNGGDEHGIIEYPKVRRSTKLRCNPVWGLGFSVGFSAESVNKSHSILHQS